jgi:hypothetical protein
MSFRGRAKGSQKEDQEKKLRVQLLRQGATLLLDMPLWIPDLQQLHGGKSLGTHLQRRELAMSGLRFIETLLTKLAPQKSIYATSGRVRARNGLSRHYLSDVFSRPWRMTNGAIKGGFLFLFSR